MFAELLKEQIRNDPVIAGMLTAYMGKPAFFYQKSPPDTDTGWTKPCYPRVDYNIDMRFDPERKTSGILTVNVWCNEECAAMPEDIDKRLQELIGGTLYTVSGGDSVCAVWNRSDAFEFDAVIKANAGIPEIFGVTLIFDLMEFPKQITAEPDPIGGLECWTRHMFPDMSIVASDDMPPVWKPSDENPAIYWRFESMEADDRQSAAVTWFEGQFAAHVMAGGVSERNRLIKGIAESMRAAGEVILGDGSPMFIGRIVLKTGADPLREGQIVLTGRYGTLTDLGCGDSAALLTRINMGYGGKYG